MENTNTVIVLDREERGEIVTQRIKIKGNFADEHIWYDEDDRIYRVSDYAVVEFLAEHGIDAMEDYIGPGQPFTRVSIIAKMHTIHVTITQAWDI